MTSITQIDIHRGNPNKISEGMISSFPAQFESSASHIVVFLRSAPIKRLKDVNAYREAGLAPFSLGYQELAQISLSFLEDMQQKSSSRLYIVLDGILITKKTANVGRIEFADFVTVTISFQALDSETEFRFFIHVVRGQFERLVLLKITCHWMFYIR
ncbi:hypothetical protein Pan241w_35900 [Gimesia alba]|uniref:Uncharacterized protein n=1 Tax=Gimesia alba TaxID=2527973 RepID=A0A517RHZ0_9PLAN|nr:hypothetical protein Pan241w_35900 [Gimesia alba]